MSKRITIEELQSYLWNSAVLLRTNIDAGAYKQYIFPLLFFKRICDVYDEETALAIEEYGDDAAEFDADEIHTFVVPKGYHWNDVRAVSENVGVAIVEAFRKVENANIDKLQGIFGDGAWTNKNRLPDRLLKDLLEHFSTKTLSIANCPEDELGQGYEYLIKKFADDSGHTAQEFYTNRTVVHLMTEMLKPESGESIYDPTCGSAGMLISAIAYLKEQGKEWRNVAVYGQEINALTSAIGKMNLFLHGVKDFNIVNGDTLKAPAFVENGRLKQFDLILANPPYSISQWDRAAFESDKYAIVLTGVIDDSIEINFNVNQIQEEKKKIEFLTQNPDCTDEVFELEDHNMLKGQIGIIGLDNLSLGSRFSSLFACSWDKIDCALMTLGNYGQQERNKWRYQFASKSLQYAWDELFHKSANAGFENTHTILVELLKSKESFDDGILDGIISAFLAQCEKDNLYPWNYYYVKYPVFRPGSYGKMSNDDVVNKPYMFSVMQTKTQWSQNTYMPYLKEADDDHLSRDEMGQYLVYDDVYIVCENNSYGVYRNDDDSLTDTVTISQNEAGIDTEDRIIKLKKYIANMK